MDTYEFGFYFRRPRKRHEYVLDNGGGGRGGNDNIDDSDGDDDGDRKFISLEE